MATSNPPRVATDGRSRYTHQAYDVTYGGKSIESGPAGYGKRLSATYQANFQLTIDLADTAPQVFSLPPYVYCNKLVVAEAGAGVGAVATIATAAPDGSGSENKIVGLAMSAVSASDVALTNNVDVVDTDQLVTVTMTVAGTGTATILLKCDIIQTAWK